MCPERQINREIEVTIDIVLNIEINQRKIFFSYFAIGNVSIKFILIKFLYFYL